MHTAAPPPDPSRDEAPGGQARGFGGRAHEINERPNATPRMGRAVNVTGTPIADKEFTTAAARCALAGAALTRLPAHGFEPEQFIVSWRGLTRSFGALGEVNAWLSRFEGDAR